MKPQTVQIVRQGEATPYWFKFNPLYVFDIGWQSQSVHSAGNAALICFSSCGLLNIVD